MTSSRSEIIFHRFNPQKHQDIGYRSHILNDTITSPVVGLNKLMEDLFTHAVYPEDSLDFVKQLDKEFTYYSYLDATRDYGRLHTGKSNTVLAAVYFFSRDFIAPVRNIFALNLSREFTQETDQLHFLARDGFPEFTAATFFKKEGIAFPRFNYVPLSVRLMRKINEPEMRQKLLKYLNHLGFDNSGQHVLVDIGFTGEIPHLLSQIYPNTNFIIRYLISKVNKEVMKQRPVMSSAKGFLHDEYAGTSFAPSFLLYETKVIRALEDTWSGLKTSSTNITEDEKGNLTTDSVDYNPSYEKVRREIALRGIIDCAKIFSHSLQTGNFDIDGLFGLVQLYSENLGQLLLFNDDEKLLKDLMAPHEPTNL